MEKGIQDEENTLYKQADDIAENVLDSLEKPNEELDNSNLTSNKTVNNKRYQINMNVYCSSLNDSEINRLFNIFNQKMGELY